MVHASQFGKGARRIPDALKAAHYRLGAALPPFDWSQPIWFGKEIPILNQQQTNSCTAHAAARYGMTLKYLDSGTIQNYSRRFIYSQTYIPPDGGAYIADALQVGVKKGFADDASVPEGDYSETTLRDASLNAHAVLDGIGQKYAVLDNTHDIDYLAAVCKAYRGFQTGFDGDDDMFDADGTFNVPKSQTWGHSVQVCGAMMRNGVKTLIVPNSWSAEWGTQGYGWMTEEFVTNGPLFDAYVLADVADIDPQSMTLTAQDVVRLQALEGYADPAGVTYWTGKTLDEYLAARIPDKITTLQQSIA